MWSGSSYWGSYTTYRQCSFCCNIKANILVTTNIPLYTVTWPLVYNKHNKCSTYLGGPTCSESLAVCEGFICHFKPSAYYQDICVVIDRASLEHRGMLTKGMFSISKLIKITPDGVLRIFCRSGSDRGGEKYNMISFCREKLN